MSRTTNEGFGSAIAGVIASFQKEVLLTEVTSSIGNEFLTVYPAVPTSRTDVLKMMKDAVAVNVQLERIRHGKTRQSMVPLDAKSSFLVFFPEGSFSLITTSSFPTEDGLVRDSYVEPVIFGKTYQGFVRCELRRNDDSNTANSFPFVLRETLLDSGGNPIQHPRNIHRSEKSVFYAQRFFDQYKKGFEAECKEPLRRLKSVQEDVSKARLIVCKDIFRRTITHLREAEASNSPEQRERLLALARREFELERRRDKKSGVLRHSQTIRRNARRRVQKYNKLDREIVANWEACYQFKAGTIFAMLIRETIGIQIKPKVLRRRQQRLGLATNECVQTGPLPKS